MLWKLHEAGLTGSGTAQIWQGSVIYVMQCGRTVAHTGALRNQLSSRHVWAGRCIKLVALLAVMNGASPKSGLWEGMIRPKYIDFWRAEHIAASVLTVG